eukprot:TRINITY_DN21030_c0_g1_i1.p2 TRINITY_DN21030_c0_g1~~TRINITY_DN21030_c0_g1_i1.p2  ORF type:complete len:189 (+),score=54.08 TRINITY_DN21030_c0_g1_i1:78-569(+)
MEEERRIDPADGNVYTKAEFLLQYGGAAEWDAAGQQKGAPPAPMWDAGAAPAGSVPSPPVGPAAPGAELRISPKNGRAYHKEAFLKYFGGLAEWDAAAIAPPGMEPGRGSSKGGKGAGVRGGKGGKGPPDWRCHSCGFARNYASRGSCYQCRAPRPMAGYSPY